MKEYFPDASNANFEFKEVSQDEVKKEVLHLHFKKPSASSSIPATILKQSIAIYIPFLTNSLNYTIKKCELPDKFRKSEVIPLYKKEDLLKNENYQLVSQLRIYQRFLNESYTNRCMEDKLSKYITSFWKAHRTQHFLITML